MWISAAACLLQRCTTYDGPSFYLDAEEGTLLCANCAAKAGKSCNLDAGALFALRHICLVEGQKIFAFKISIGSLNNKLSAVAEQYALHHFDKPLKSYSFSNRCCHKWGEYPKGRL